MPSPSSSPPDPTVEIRRGPDDELIVRFPFDLSIVRRIRRVPGRRWREREGHWTIPARVTPLLLFLRSLGGTEVWLDPSLEPLLPPDPPPDARWRFLDPEVSARLRSIATRARAHERRASSSAGTAPGPGGRTSGRPGASCGGWIARSGSSGPTTHAST